MTNPRGLNQSDNSAPNRLAKPYTRPILQILGNLKEVTQLDDGVISDGTNSQSS